MPEPDRHLAVVAFPRRKAVHLAIVCGEESAGTRRAMLDLLSEDGARFRLPTRVALARLPGVLPGLVSDTDELLTARLAELRASLPETPGWEALRGLVDDAESLSVEELAQRAGLEGASGVLAVALGLEQAAPWFRRSDGRLVAVERERALAELARIEAARRATEEDAALEQSWRAFRSGAAPAPTLDQESGAVRELVMFALSGEPTQHPRGEKLAQRMECAEPDQALARLVEWGVLAPDVNPAPHRAGVAEPPSAAALAEAAELAAASPEPTEDVEASGDAREDLTALHTVAIDSATTLDVDDALSARITPDGLELLIHIADVASVVRTGTALDRHAWDRACTLYAPDGSVPMLPDDVVGRRLSLLAGERRPAVTARLVVHADGSTGPCAFVRSWVRVDRNVAYEETSDPASYGGDAETGRALLAAAQALKAARVAAGARILDIPSLEVTLEDGRPLVGPRHTNTPGDLIVGEAMVLYNHRAATALAAAGWAAVFRGQAAGTDPLPAPDDPLLPVRARRAFAPTEVRAEPQAHAGLGVDAYLQATSPIRRYGDLVNQRQLVAHSAGATPPYPPAAMQAVADHVTGRERRLRRAGDERARYWIARWLQAQIERGERTEFEGLLARAPRRGLGSVYVPELCRELPLRAPRHWAGLAEGEAGRFAIGRIAPFGGRIELVPQPEGEQPAAGATQ